MCKVSCSENCFSVSAPGGGGANCSSTLTRPSLPGEARPLRPDDVELGSLPRTLRDSALRPDDEYRRDAPGLLRQIARLSRQRLGPHRQRALAFFRADGRRSLEELLLGSLLADGLGGELEPLEPLAWPLAAHLATRLATRNESDGYPKRHSSDSSLRGQAAEQRCWQADADARSADTGGVGPTSGRCYDACDACDACDA